MKGMLSEYNEAPTIQFPIDAEHLRLPNGKGIGLSAVGGPCHNCDGKIEQPHGTVKEFNTCLDVDYSGICPSCGEITRYRFRWYPNERRIVYFKGDCIEEHRLVETKGEKLFFTVLYWVIDLWNKTIGRNFIDI